MFLLRPPSFQDPTRSSLNAHQINEEVLYSVTSVTERESTGVLLCVCC